MLNRTTTIDARVNIHQQPNDAADAARLHGEMIAKATAEVANATVATFGANNELTVLKIESSRNFATEQLNVRLIFKLNGHLYDFAVEDVDKVEDEAMHVVAAHLMSRIMNMLFRGGRRP